MISQLKKKKHITLNLSTFLQGKRFKSRNRKAVVQTGKRVSGRRLTKQGIMTPGEDTLWCHSGEADILRTPDYFLPFSFEDFMNKGRRKQISQLVCF